ncbi:serine hydrolase domain-containing protein [Terricaulis sp.]|uniref:serine hydrolase domain-containing protein n=1 Tax=Terricaulis sp. TaxID=2768686 RepID=UPI00378471DE
MLRALLFSALLAACASAPADRPRSALAEAAIDTLAEQGFTGSVLVACGGDVIYARDVGVQGEPGRAPSYWLASISKQFTAAAILTLAEQHKLSLDEPLSRFFPFAPSDKASITLRQLLTHQSGLGQVYAADGVTDRDVAARAIFATPLNEAPGTRFRYSNDNFTLLAMVVEIASGQSFESYVHDHVFAPAGLRNAGFWPAIGGDIAPPALAPPQGANAQANWGFRGGTGMRASVRDLHAWTRALDAHRVLTAESVALLYGPHTQASDGDGVGFGWFWTEIDGRQWLWTRGSEDFGPNAILYRRRDTGLAIIAATNAGPAESAGPGWSRRARDALMPLFADACSEATR